MQISVVWTINARTASIDKAVANLAELKEEGFRRVWTTQMPNEPDALTMLTVAGREVPEIEFGTSVLPMQVQHPMLLAQRALTTQAVIGPRLNLGIGLSHQVVTEGMWGVSYKRPVARTSEFLDGLLPLLNGEKVSAAGDLLTTRGALTMQDIPAPPVYLAALGPKMLGVAGSRTAGTVTWMTGPKTLRDHIVPTLRAAAVGAGRAESDVRTVATLPVSVTDDVDGARESAAAQFAMYDSLPSYKAMLDREGFTGPVDTAIVGDEATVADRIRELSDYGVDEYVGILFDRDPEVRARTRALLRSLDG
ncbi:TIGR03564 family F420-dependent LLM class oxidoreductase [Gordonia sp. (in: high G+C Gram-positive bacteria)]|uniref:TIGR03564 family F420-dependent LLM class oxidoreductase n=1 Tax=Gordonia sp. (in: high G+C Gram-positive bacteria) TaxID=84139 RepID=UPI00169E285F|nr:TIGR03564 family F420-dependent LLM class oxidoreductase [Gordonia sp. (in: high G+C Gram-positive bacteria)]NLG46794.1 TIGR03564 family F420-dependent LLM class oxidoreductase [Gordonia sp. (in: high G+C Gram-positive bacteria)]